MLSALEEDPEYILSIIDHEGGLIDYLDWGGPEVWLGTPVHESAIAADIAIIAFKEAFKEWCQQNGVEY